MEIKEILSHPLINTIITLLVGSLLVLFLTKKWQNADRNFFLIREYLKKLHSVSAQIRLLRRVNRVENNSSNILLSNFTDIENSLHELFDDTDFVFNSVKIRREIKMNLEISIKYFRDITQEIEKLGMCKIKLPFDNKKNSPELNNFKSFFLSATPEYSANVVNPGNTVRNMVHNALKKYK